MRILSGPLDERRSRRGCKVSSFPLLSSSHYLSGPLDERRSCTGCKASSFPLLSSSHYLSGPLDERRSRTGCKASSFPLLSSGEAQAVASCPVRTRSRVSPASDSALKRALSRRSQRKSEAFFKLSLRRTTCNANFLKRIPA